MSAGRRRTLHFLLLKGYLERYILIVAKYIHKAGGVPRQARTYLVTMTLTRLLILFITMKISYWDFTEQKVQNHDYLSTAARSAFPKAWKDTVLETDIRGGEKPMSMFFILQVCNCKTLQNKSLLRSTHLLRSLDCNPEMTEHDI